MRLNILMSTYTVESITGHYYYKGMSVTAMFNQQVFLSFEALLQLQLGSWSPP